MFEEVVKLFESVLIDLSGFGLYTDIEELEDAWKEIGRASCRERV